MIIQIRPHLPGELHDAVLHHISSQLPAAGHTGDTLIQLQAVRRFQDIPDGGDGSAVQDPGKLHLLFPVHPPDLFCQAADLLEPAIRRQILFKAGDGGLHFSDPEGNAALSLMPSGQREHLLLRLLPAGKRKGE